MGLHHRFRGLKDHATKRRSLKQKKLYETELLRDGRESMDSGHLYIASKGICASLSVHWATHVDDYSTESKVEKIYRKCAGTHFRYTVTGDIGDVLKANGAKRDAELGATVARAAGAQAEIDRLILVWYKHADRDASAFVSYEFAAGEGVTGGHGVAVHKAREGGMSFFEPNAGIYDIDPGNEAAFLAAYSGIVREVYGSIQKLELLAFR